MGIITSERKKTNRSYLISFGRNFVISGKCLTRASDVSELWNDSLREKYKGSVYIGQQVTPSSLNCLFTSWLLLQSSFSNSPKFWNITLRIFHWLRIVAKIRFKTWLWLSVQIVEQLLVYARLDLYSVLPSFSDMHISHFLDSGVMMLPRLHQELYPFWPKPGGGNSPSQPNHNKITTDSSAIPQDIGLAFCSEGFGYWWSMIWTADLFCLLVQLVS